jgi:uncharacterized protein DUF5670
MFLLVALVLLVLWAVGFFIFPAVGVLIHILLVLAIISVLWHFLTGRGMRV